MNMKVMKAMSIISLISFVSLAYGFSVSIDKKHVFPGETFHLNFSEVGPCSYEIEVSLEDQTQDIYVHLSPGEYFQKMIELKAPTKPGDYKIFVGETQLDLIVEEPVIELEKLYLTPDTANPNTYIKLTYGVSNPSQFAVSNVTIGIDIDGIGYTYEREKLVSQIMMPGNSIEQTEVIKVGPKPTEATLHFTLSYIFDGELHSIEKDLDIHTPSFPWIAVAVIVIIIVVTAYYLRKRM